MLNEARHLPELLWALKSQSRRPDEIVFVDAGSSDGSADIVHRWWGCEGWPGLGYQVIRVPDAFPGAGRNAGIRVAHGECIAFIDVGIYPEHSWLESLEQALDSSGAPGVFGVCCFEAEPMFQRTLCALSNGLGAVYPVVPASLFWKEVFSSAGYFPESLRAAEDLVWVLRYESTYGSRLVCQDAKVFYRNYPTTWVGAARKWQTAEYFSVLAGVRTSQQLALIMLLPLLYLALISGTAGSVLVFSTYLILRGVADPIRRSRSWHWWWPHPRAIFIAIPMCVVMDAAKLLGMFQGMVACGLRRVGVS